MILTGNETCIDCTNPRDRPRPFPSTAALLPHTSAPTPCCNGHLHGVRINKITSHCRMNSWWFKDSSWCIIICNICKYVLYIDIYIYMYIYTCICNISILLYLCLTYLMKHTDWYPSHGPHHVETAQVPSSSDVLKLFSLESPNRRWITNLSSSLWLRACHAGRQ